MSIQIPVLAKSAQYPPVPLAGPAVRATPAGGLPDQSAPSGAGTAKPTTVADLLTARQAQSERREGSSILIYGGPRTGKTLLAATIAKIPYIRRVFWFDLEKGIETLIYARKGDGSPYFTKEELAKIILFNVKDTSDRPVAATTLLKAFSATQPIPICQAHGAIACKEGCLPADHIPFSLRTCNWEDAVVIDSGSQLADSVLNMEKALYQYKDLRKYYGEFNLDMGSILGAIQASSTNVVMVTHDMEIYEGVDPDKRFVGIFPNCGSQNFSRKVARSFGYVIYNLIELNRFKAGSGPMFKPKVLTGSRTGVAIETTEGATLVDLLLPQPAQPATKPTQETKPTMP